MRKIEFFILFLIPSIILLDSCGNKRHKPDLFNIKDSNNVVSYIQDTSLYMYDQNLDTSYFVLNLGAGFMRYSLESINDSIVIIGYRGSFIDSAFLKKTGEPMICPCTEEDSFVLNGVVQFDIYDQFSYNRITYNAINIYSKEKWIYKIIDLKFARYNKSRQDARTTYFDQFGNIISIKDTATYCDSWTMPGFIGECDSSGKYIIRTQFVDNKSVEVSDEGSLYIWENGSRKILLTNNSPRQELKTRNGYYDPDISPDGNFVVYRRMITGWEIYGCQDEPKDSGIFEININDKKITKLISPNARSPSIRLAEDIFWY